MCFDGSWSQAAQSLLDMDRLDYGHSLCRKWQRRVIEKMSGSAALEAKAKRYGDLDEPFYRCTLS